MPDIQITFFLVVENEQDIEDLKVLMENNSTLKFTHEIGYDRLPFLDLNLSYNNNNEISTEIYVKPTKTGNLLNHLSECPDKYKTGVIVTLYLTVH